MDVKSRVSKLQTLIKNEYYVVPSKTGPTKGKGTLGMEGSKESLGLQKIRPGLATLVSDTKSASPTGSDSKSGSTQKTDGDPLNSSDPDQATLLAIRDQLLSTRFHKMDKSSNALKHFYFYQAQNASDTETTQVLNNVPQDTSGGLVNNERVGTQIRLKRLKIRSVFAATPSSAQTGSSMKQICYRIVIWREFVPLTPGTPPTCFQTDANPPASGTAVFSRLGNPSTSGEINMLAIRNPMTDRLYHIYHDEVHTLRNIMVNNAASNSQVMAPYEHHQNFDIDLHNLVMDYSGTTANSYLTNGINITCITEQLATAGQTCVWQYISEVVFDDGSEVQ